jgi:hypothetical protein
MIAIFAVTVCALGSASADSLCEKNINPCPLANSVAKGAKIAGLAQAAKLLGSGLSSLLTCKSEALGEVTKTGSGNVLGTLTKLLFTNCEGPCTKAHGINLPYSVEANATQVDAFFTGATNHPGALIEGCPFGLECKYESNTNPLLMGVFGDTLIAFEIKLTLQNPSLCSVLMPAEAEFDATYLITLDPKVGEHVTLLFLVAKP